MGGCRRFVALTLAAGLLTAPRAAIEANAAAEPRWIMLRSGMLTLVGDQPPDKLRDVAIQIEQFRAVVGGLIHDADRPLSTPAILFVLGDRKAMQPLVPVYKGRPAVIAGYFGRGADANYLVLSLEGFEESAAITYHEYTHLLLRNAVRSLPVWLDEGLAEFYSTYRLVDQGKAAEIGRPVSQHLALLRQNYMPIAELIAVDHSSSLYNEGERRSIFYAESWALTHYLMTVRPNGQIGLNAYGAQIAEGHSPDDAFREAFGVSPADLDKELREYVKRPSFTGTRHLFSEKLTVAEPAPPRTMTAGEVDAWIGDAQRRVSRTDEAAVRIERAVRAEPNTAMTQLALGLLRLAQDRDADGLDALGRAAELAPQDFMTQYIVGMSMIRSDGGDRDDHRAPAYAALQRAVALNRSSSDALAALAYVQMLSKETLAAARGSIERAIALSPGRLDYRLRFADIQILQGQLAPARDLLKQLEAVTTDQTVSEAATKRLIVVTERLRAEAAAASRSRAESPSRPAETPAKESVDTASSETRFMLRAVHAGEERALGALAKIDCTRQGVRFTLQTDEGPTVVAAVPKLEDVELTTFVDAADFTLRCGPRNPADRVYLTWRVWGPDEKPIAGVVGTAIALEFLPADYRPR